MQDPNQAAFANAIAGGQAFGQGLRGWLNYAQERKKTASELQTADINRQLIGLQVAEAQRQRFLSETNPWQGASQRILNQARANVTPPASDVKPSATVPGHVEFPFPATKEKAEALGIPWGDDETQRPATWSMPKEVYAQRTASPAVATPSPTDLQEMAPWEMEPGHLKALQDEIIASGKAKGVNIAPGEAYGALANQFQQTHPFYSAQLQAARAAASRLVPVKMTTGEKGPETTYERPFGSGMLTKDDVLKTLPEITKPAAGTQANTDALSIQKDADRISSLVKQSKTDPLYGHVSDFNLMKFYIYTINPRLRQQPVEQELWSKSVPQHLLSAVQTVWNGKTLLPSERDEIARLAGLNAQAAQSEAYSAAAPYVNMGRQLGIPESLLPQVGIPPEVSAPATRDTGRAGTEVPATPGNTSRLQSGGMRTYHSAGEADAAEQPEQVVRVFNPDIGRYQRYRTGR